ncbi:MAG: phospholipid-binding protein MlaC [Granulosicoccus sp.]
MQSVELKVKMIRQAKIVLLFALAAFLGSVAVAAEHPAQQKVQAAITAMLDVYESDGERLKSDPQFLKAKVDELIVPNIDFESMTKLAVGKFWRRASGDQKTELVGEFKTLLLNTYTSALTEYSGETAAFEPFRPESREDRAVVRSSFSQKTGADIPVVYKLRDRAGWLIYDIEVNNLSLVTSYRAAFSNEIEQDGIAGLISTLKERNGAS